MKILFLTAQFVLKLWFVFLDQSNMEKNSEPDTFGFYQHFERVERGWLTSETAIQFKFFNNPIELWIPGIQNRPVGSNLGCIG